MPLDIAHAIQELIRSGKTEGDGDVTVMPGFKTVDIYPIFEHAFTEKAKATLLNKTNNQLYQYNRKIVAGPALILLGKLGLKTCKMWADATPDGMYVRDFDLVHYAASRATKEKLPQAIMRVIDTVNIVAEKDFTKAALVQLSVIELARVNTPEPEFVVISYVTLTKKGAEYVAQHMSDRFIPEGGLPDRIE